MSAEVTPCTTPGDPEELRAIVLPRRLADFLFGFVNSHRAGDLTGKDVDAYVELIGVLANNERSAADLIPQDRRHMVHEVGVWTEQQP
ncbi:hypothetical protein E6C67_08525 [Azospirillum sp. TSA2s]|uniref:hypothetical protein n=1 Tax=Azospirillum sp. TSA2s TaxID=709810 RepID=UPI0010AA6C4D|nr:hypothetical protein [Azospirillum sp. TSA2s]QCG93983.1 hypothetical protein E6C67_08525 [Azospirillum sp. TSA2s]